MREVKLHVPSIRKAGIAQFEFLVSLAELLDLARQIRGDIPMSDVVYICIDKATGSIESKSRLMEAIAFLQ